VVNRVGYGESAGAVAAPPPTPALPRLRRELPAGLAVIAVAGLLGVPLGLLWSVVSPPVHVVITSAGADLANYGSDELFAVDATFALLGAAVGVVTGLALWFLARSHRGPVLMVALVLGSLAGGLVAWAVGRQIGLAHYHSLVHSTVVGRRFTKPVDLRSKAALVPQPFSALVGYLVSAALVARPDLGRRPVS